MRTESPAAEKIQRNWVLVDAQDQVLGRLATRIATILRGKHKVVFTPHVDSGDFVVVVNAAKIRLTGKKWSDKMYHFHSGYPGGLKSLTARQVFEKDPARLVFAAVQGMLPGNKLAESIIKKLKVYSGAEHPHAAQKPATLN